MTNDYGVIGTWGHRDRYIGSLFRTSEPVTMIPDRHMRRPEIVEKIRKAMSVVLEIEA